MKVIIATEQLEGYPYAAEMTHLVTNKVHEAIAILKLI